MKLVKVAAVLYSFSPERVEYLLNKNLMADVFFFSRARHLVIEKTLYDLCCHMKELHYFTI